MRAESTVRLGLTKGEGAARSAEAAGVVAAAETRTVGGGERRMEGAATTVAATIEPYRGAAL